jgi:hypothetical protein
MDETQFLEMQHVCQVGKGMAKMAKMLCPDGGVTKLCVCVGAMQSISRGA